jgi:hypothetical protein
MSDVKVVRKRTGTILSDGISKYCVTLCAVLWPQFGNLTVTRCMITGHTGVEIRVGIFVLRLPALTTPSFISRSL